MKKRNASLIMRLASMALCVVLVACMLPKEVYAVNTDIYSKPADDTVTPEIYANDQADDQTYTEPDVLNKERNVYDNASGGVVTGTQQAALDNETDVDRDIAEEVNSRVGIDWEYIEISTADELMQLAKNCALDTWSRNKHVTLSEDISLLGKEFSGIPTFGGVFDGHGHTISELYIDNGESYVGLFSYVQEDAVIRNLKVSGTVAPSGDQVMVGGIAGDNSGVIAQCSFDGIISGHDYVGAVAGMNELTGVISGCSVSGYVKGIHFTGGIAGENMGNITGCTNNSPVNTSNIDTTFTAESLNELSSIMSIIGRKGEDDTDEAKASATVTDTGGIAGLSIGIISHCVNHGPIGYEHVGYNTGGIAGRQSGYIYACTNNGEILGRKDVGGIVGQAEPYITIDFSQDVAYQLSEAIGKLHDLVNVTLNDTRNQSDTITGRLSVIQQFTGNAINDAKYIAQNTVDFANGVTGAATEAFSRVDYILAESSKQDGLLDQTAYAYTNIGSAMESVKTAVKDSELTQYMSTEDKAAYDSAKNTIELSTTEFKDYYSKAYKAYYNYYVWKHAGESTASNGTIDLAYKIDGSDPIQYTYASDPLTLNGNSYSRSDITIPSGTVSDEQLITDFGTSGTWVHNTAAGDFTFPYSEYSNDGSLAEKAASQAANWANSYASSKYLSVHGTAYTDDMANAGTEVTRVLYKAMDAMSAETRTDAINAANSLEAAASNLSSAGSQTKGIVSNLASRGAVTFPTLSADYKVHTTSLADNLKVMNDNFGLLNEEINGATDVLTDDLEAVSDQFNTIMLLYTDALDGVLEKDYNSVITDDSLSEAQTCTDATVDSCYNYGTVEGDINVAGISGTMAIEYDYDLESDVTGIRDSDLNTSYITKCVVRGNKNYADVDCVKNYAGGICGLQEMGTVIADENYAYIRSDSGDYVGGICGSSISYIVRSYSKGNMEGGSYIGGIAGDGMHIRDSISIVDLKASGNWSGAIAGHVSEDGEVRNNYFVSDSLAGIDRVSYSLKAEPRSYSELMNMDETFLPSDFGYLTVTYKVDDEDNEDTQTISKARVNYGSSIDVCDYPGTRPKEGFYVEWDKEKVDHVTTDDTITATYKRYLTTLASSAGSDHSHQSELLVDGNFKEGDSLVAARTINYNSEDTSSLSEYETIELIIPDDKASVHQIRFNPDTVYGDKLEDNFDLYVMTEDGWKVLTSTGRMGGYYTYDVTGNEVKLRLDVSAMEKEGYKTMALIILAIVAGIAVLILITVIAARHMNRKRIHRAVKHMKKKIRTQIDNKEQLFIPDSAEEDDTDSAGEDAPDNTEEDTADTKDDTPGSAGEDTEKRDDR
ncbi:MAG: hypothetical protein K6G12_09440 [Lachnospiraceae bacterium]|nr:hypothetical protein [Lachnospiraceae bacterium]